MSGPWVCPGGLFFRAADLLEKFPASLNSQLSVKDV